MHSDLTFLPEIMKINKCNKPFWNDDNEFVIHIRPLKQALNYGLILKRVHRVI